MRPAIRFGRALDEGLSSLFYCWTRTAIPGGECFRREDPASFWQVSWDEDEYTFFRKACLIKPRGYVTVSMRSRECFRYGVFQLNARLPAWGDGPMLWFGFESEDLFGGGVIHFMLHSGELRMFAGAWGGLLSLRLPGLPQDYAEKRHTYTVRVHDTLAIWLIDDRLRGVAVLADSEAPLAVHEGPPYSIGLTPIRPSSALGVLLDIDGGPIDREWVWSDVHPWQVRVHEGTPSPSLLLRLRRWGSEDLLAGERVSGSVLSHPVPSLGVRATYTLVFDGKATVTVQRLTLGGEWVDEDELKVEGGLARIKAPSDAPATRLRIEGEGVLVRSAEVAIIGVGAP